jgi:hypothetical protein
LDVDASDQNSEINMTRTIRLSFVIVVVVASLQSLRVDPLISQSAPPAIASATPALESW